MSLKKAIRFQVKLNLTRACPITKLSFPNAVKAHTERERIVHRELAVVDTRHSEKAVLEGALEMHC